MKISAVLLAAGASRRFRFPSPRRKSALSKVFYLLATRPILTHSLDTLAAVRSVREIILVVPPAHVNWVRRTFLKKYPCAKVSAVVGGGRERSDSSYAGFRAILPRSTHVLIHDAARPLVSKDAVEKLIRKLGQNDGAILAKPVTPTIKRVGNRQEIISTVLRDRLWEAETPQLFRVSSLKKAFQMYRTEAFSVSDDAGLCERTGAKIRVVENPEPNIKITSFSDYRLAARYLGNGSAHRSGMGHDLHRLVPRRPLMLGGVKIPSRLGALGHSDGDALLHAVTDALLGAACLGDIGDWFPDTAARYRGISSAVLLTKVKEAVRKAGYRAVHVDVTVHLERPKLGEYKERIRVRLARLLSLEKRHVNIKAKTAEGLGAIGKGQAVAADAVVTVEML